MALERARFEIWIDAAATSAVRVFGMSLVERQLAAIDRLANGSQRSCEIVRVVVEHAPGRRPEIDATLSARLGVAFAEAQGSFATRIARMAASAGAVVLALDGDAILDTRAVAELLRGTDTVVAFGGEASKRTALLRLAPGARIPERGASAAELGDALLASGAARELRLDAVAQHIANLRRDEPVYAFRIAADEVAATERWLFWSNYKGSTDFLTRWVFPPFVWALLRPLARLRVHPNWVTGLALVLCFGAIPLWATGHWGVGFVAAYAMAVLDSVDGKLARLTYTTSSIGNVMDHGADLIHPPFWYAAWAWGMAGGPIGPTYELTLWLFGLYTLDRLLAPLFLFITGKSIHGYAPIDVKMRTFISRRNVNLPVFTLALPLGLGEAAIVFVVAWQAACFVFHAVRVVQVWHEKRATA